MKTPQGPPFLRKGHRGGVPKQLLRLLIALMTTMCGLGGHRGSPPPIRYPMPSRTEAMRRNPSVTIYIVGFVMIMMALLGFTHIINGKWPLGLLEILVGVFVTVFVLRRFRHTI